MSFTQSELYAHQRETAEFLRMTPKAFVTSSPGTGKTRSVLEAFSKAPERGRMLVLAPKSILQPSWGNDIEKFTPELSYGIATAKDRKGAFTLPNDVVITNHDAVKWVDSNADVLQGFTTLVIDEFTAFKNRGSQRSKALNRIKAHFERRIALSGTPNSNSITDLWHPALVLDDGERLGNNFFRFRSATQTPTQVGPSANMMKWSDKEGSVEAVTDTLSDITIRHKFEDCLDVPENTVRKIFTTLSPAHMSMYEDIRDNFSTVLPNGEPITFMHAASKVKKLLQLVTGAMYDAGHLTREIHTERYELVMQLVAEREHTLVGFNYRHERNNLVALATKMKIPFGFIDGSVSDHGRTKAVEDMQAGKLQVLFAQPQSAAHGLTLTKATTTIWSSPTYNAEHFTQFNNRVYRAGQTNKTETILIAAKDTHEEHVYDVLNSKVENMDVLLDLFKQLTNARRPNDNLQEEVRR
jgi:SNF2 family DNA or RNA helicase